MTKFHDLTKEPEPEKRSAILEQKCRTCGRKFKAVGLEENCYVCKKEALRIADYERLTGKKAPAPLPKLSKET